MSDTNGTADKVKDAQAEAQEIAQKTAEELKEWARELRKRADAVRVEAVKQLHQAAETIRKEARERSADESIKQSADKIAKGLEKTAHYLNTHTVEQMSEDAAATVRKNPLRTLAVVFLVGLIVGIFLRRSD